MPTKLLITILILGLLNQRASAQYEINDNCSQAWEALLDLRINTAKEIVEREIGENPDNYYAYYLDQNCDAFELMISTTSEGYEAFKDNYENRREIMDDMDVDSPYYLACESEMQLQMGIFNIIYGDLFTGLRRAYSAYNKTYKNIERYPDFQPNRKLDGMFNMSISNLPPFVSWAAALFGVSGSAETSLLILKNYFKFYAKTPGLKQEAALYIILAHKLNKDPFGAYSFIKSLDSSYFAFNLLKYFYANVAYRSGKNEEALKIFSSFNPEELEIKFNPYNYLFGKIMLRKLDSTAIKYFKKYLTITQEKDYLKEMHYQLALAYLINGNKNAFIKHKQNACELGDNITERDREAMYDCNLDYLPDVNLVKAKLLLDGGYLINASKWLENFRSTQNDKGSNSPYNLEYYLLKGRCEYIVGNNEQAILEFNKVIADGENEDYYFASEAAMYLGFIYEKTDSEKALLYFKKACNLYESDYYEYIDEISKKRITSLGN
ncbi:MAG: hypothetical protein H8E34_08540 [Bacteroidetes bacterium]|nr:hypothetical protein [Bacteroidota bacterium]MBL6943904.1 hypothetical protein [Bacteroidales bacterium]